MSGMPWVKLYTEFLDDPKVGFLSEGAQLLLVKLFLLAGECDAEGYLANGDECLTTEHIAWRLRLAPDVFASRWDELEARGFVDRDDDGALSVRNFQKRQGRSQSDKRELWRRRKARQRENEAGQDSDTDECHAGLPRDTGECHAPRERVETEGEQDHVGADAPAADAAQDATPSTFPEWQERIKGTRKRAPVLLRMIETLYPGLSPPSYGYINKVAKEVGGAGRLADLLWQHSTRPPTGDLMAYIRKVAQNGKRGNNGKPPTREVEQATGWVDDLPVPGGPDAAGVGDVQGGAGTASGP